MDRDKAIALERVKREECPRCHTLREDWIDPETNRPSDEPTYAAVARQCPGCDEVERVESTVPKKLRGTFVTLIQFADLEDEDDAILTETDRHLHEVKA